VNLARAYRDTLAELLHVIRADTPTHSALRDRLVVITLTTVALDLVCAVLALLLERHVPNTDISSFGSALFWTTTQLLTVSSQIQNPLSVGGRLLDVLMEVYAITVVATLAGVMGAFLVRRAREAEQAAGRDPDRGPGRTAQG
jgi:hypothetical protein